MSSSAKPTDRASRPSTRSIAEDEVYASVPRRWPPLGMLFNPRFILQTVSQFVIVWCASRPLKIIAGGLPALLLGMATVGIAFSVRSSINEDKFVSDYRIAFNQALKDKDERAQEVLLNALLSIEPDHQLYRFILAELRIRQNRIANGFATMRSLADESNYVPAHRWLAEQLDRNPAPGAIRETIRHLKEIVKQDSESQFANAVLGKKYLELGQPSLAESFLRKAAPGDPLSRMRLAACVKQLGRTEDAKVAVALAEHELRGQVEENAENSVARIGWAKCLYLLGRHEEARSVLVQGLALTNEDPDLRRALANLMTDFAYRERTRGVADVNRCAELLTQALRIDPENPNAILQMAELPLKPGQVDPDLLAKIHEYVKGLTEKRPQGTDALRLLAWTQQMQGDDALAVVTMQTVVRNRPEIRLSLALLYRLTDQPDLAEKEAKATVEYFTAQCAEKPDDPNLHVRLAQATEFLGDHSAATEIIDDIQAANPRPELDEQLQALAIRFRLTHFDSLEKAQAPDRALQLQLAEEILQLDSTSTAAIKCLAALMRVKDDVAEQARDQMLEQLSVSPMHTVLIHSLLGALAELDGDFEAAHEHLLQANRRMPDDPVVCNNLAHVMANVDGADLDRALELANHALSKMPNHPEILETRGEVLVKMNQFSEALTDLERCLGRSGDPRDVHRLLAAAYKGLGNAEMAAKHQKLSE